jgi:hypothetical protein
MSTQNDATSEVKFADIEDVIAAAAKAKNEEAQRLSVEELEEMAVELDIPKHLIAPAVEEVRRRREAELAAERAKVARTQRMRRAFTIGGGVLGVLVLVLSGSTYSALSDAKLAADRQRAQVINVIDRQRATIQQWASAPESSDKQAELSGAENRVRIERARYDQLATEYRRHAGGRFGWLVTSLTSYPSTLPLSSETAGW